MKLLTPDAPATKPDNRKTIRIAPELWASIKAEAALAQCTIAELIRRMFEKWKAR